MKKSAFVSIFSVISLFWTEFALANPDISQCDAYQTKVNTLQCSEDNYLLSFGYKYCRLFIQDEDTFTKDGKVILANIRSCLLREMVNDDQMTCENSKSRSLQQHVNCYIENEFCMLSFTDDIQIYKRVKGELTDPEFKESFDQIRSFCGF